MSGIPALPRSTVVGGDVIVNIFSGLKHSDRLEVDLDHIILATEELIGEPLRHELFQTVSIEENLKLCKRGVDVKQPVLVEGKPFRVSTGDPSDEWMAACTTVGELMTLRFDAKDSRINFDVYMHELAHGIYTTASSKYIIDFSRIYHSLRSRVIDKILSGKDPVVAAASVLSDSAFLRPFSSGSDGFICWKGFVGEDFQVTDSDLKKYFHRQKVPEVAGAHRLLHTPEEAFCETFAHYFRLERSKREYKIVPDEKFARHKQLYAFCQENMQAILDSARPEARASRSLL